MLNKILNIIGLLFIGYAIYIIKKDINNSKNKLDELSLIEESTRKHYEYTDNIVSSFEKLVDLKLESIETDSEIRPNNSLSPISSEIKQGQSKKMVSREEKSKNSTLNEGNKKIIELLDLGLTKEEISKKLNKGIREVEIIIKMYKNDL